MVATVIAHRRGDPQLEPRHQRGDLAATHRLVNSNLRLVVSQSRKYQGREMALVDLVQEGNLGLIRAAFGPLLPSDRRRPDEEVEIALSS